MGDDVRAVRQGQLSGAVLKRADLPSVFVPFDDGPIQAVDRPRGRSGWKARFRRPGSTATRGPLVIESRVDLVADEDAAAGALGRVERSLLSGGADAVEAPAIGAGSIAVRQHEAAVTPVDLFTVAWHDANVVASVTVSGFAGKIRVEDAVDLARKQQRRIAAAAGSSR